MTTPIRASRLPLVLFVTLACAAVPLAAARATTVAWWRFEEGSNTTAADSSGFGNHGALLNGASWIGETPAATVSPGPGDCRVNAFALELVAAAPAQIVVAPDSPSLRPASGLTIEAWFRPRPGAWVVIGKQIGPGCCSNSYQIEIQGGGPLNFILSEPNLAQHHCNSGIQPQSGVWHHVAATWDGATMRLYLDDHLVQSLPFAGPIGYDGNPVMIGADDDGTGLGGCCPFNGEIDEVRISDVALAPGEFLSACRPLGVQEGPGVAFALRGAAPNPATGSFAIAFALPSAEPATLELFDVAGRRVLAREVRAAGRGSVQVDERLAGGIYLARLTQGPRVATARVVVTGAR